VVFFFFFFLLLLLLLLLLITPRFGIRRVDIVVIVGTGLFDIGIVLRLFFLVGFGVAFFRGIAVVSLLFGFYLLRRADR